MDTISIQEAQHSAPLNPADAKPAEGETSKLRATAAVVGNVAVTVGSAAATVGGSAIWAAGSYLSSVVANRGASGGGIGGGGAAEAGSAASGLGSAEILKMANALDGIFATSELAGPVAGRLKQPEVPRLVVVGTQSSGKSSLLNGIMGADILPLGEEMVTRAPLALQLVHHAEPSEMRAEFGTFVNGGWCVEETVELACPDPKAAQLERIRKAIEAQTAARAGSQKGVTNEAIFLRLYSPHVPNLSLVDLPGLTMTALTAQGQPKDIKQQIRQMIASYIQPARTIILMVCPARADLEADPAVELAREYDPQGTRTVGVLTKVDLMNKGTDVSKYLTNALPSDLQLSLGYFAVKMRGPAEKGLTVREGYGSEAEYFKAHATYGRAFAPFAERLGVPPLSKFLARVLLGHLKQHLPHILREVDSLYLQTERNLSDLGPAVPIDAASRSALVQNLVASFSRNVVGALVEKRADVKTGRRIKDAFAALSKELKAVKPFDESAYPDQYLLDAARDCEGNHLSFPIPPIELLEHMLTHPEKRPIRQLLPPCLGCVSAVHEELRALCTRLLNQETTMLARFPKLRAKLREEFEGLLERERSATMHKLEELIAMEEAYIYTDDESFLKELQEGIKKLVKGVEAPLLRSILSSYYATITRSVVNAAPKAIMLHMLRATENALYPTLFERLAHASVDDQGLLDEPPEMESKRRADVELLGKLRAAKRALEQLA